MKKQRILSNLSFHKIWDEAQAGSEKKEFINNVLRSPGLFPYKKEGFDYVEAFDILNEIYDKANMPYNELTKLCGLRPSKVSHEFCVPIRTVEDWAKKNQCPSYIRLYIIRTFHLLVFPKSIRTEYEEEYETNKKRTYKTKEKKKAFDTPKIKKTNQQYSKAKKDDFPVIMPKEDDPVAEILRKTDYFGDRLKMREKK